MKKLRITVEGRPYDVTLEVLSDDGVTCSEPTLEGTAAPVAASQAARTAATAAPEKPAAFNPKPVASGGKNVLGQVSGLVVSVDVAVGAQVEEGDKLLTIEAMKMNTYVMAPFAGTASEILVAKGASVLTGDVLVRLS
jgi:biotin carboxyl carrier protein